MKPVRLEGAAPFTIAKVNSHIITISDDERYEVMTTHPHVDAGHADPRVGDRFSVTWARERPAPSTAPLIRAKIINGCGCEFTLRPFDTWE